MHNSKMAQNENPITAKCIISNPNGDILLLKKSTESKSRAGLWEFAGGKIEEGEDERIGMQREVMEETGIKLLNISSDPVYMFEFNHTKKDGRKIVRDIKIYTADCDNSDVTISFEHTQYKWISKEEFLKLENIVLTRHTLGVQKLMR